MVRPLRDLVAEFIVSARDDFVELPEGEIPATLEEFLHKTHVQLCKLFTSIRIVCRPCATGFRYVDEIQFVLKVCSKCAADREEVPGTWGTLRVVKLDSMDYYIDVCESNQMELFTETSRKRAYDRYRCENCGGSTVEEFPFQPDGDCCTMDVDLMFGSAFIPPCGLLVG